MDDNAPKEDPPAGFNKIDLTQLQGFSFGTQWTQDKQGRDSRRDDGARRDDGSDRRRDDRSAADRRDRRSFRKPATGDGPGGAGAESHAPRRDFSGAGDQRGPRSDHGEFRGDSRGEGGRFSGRGGPGHDARLPYESPYFTATFYPEDNSFAALAKTIRASCRTFELFDIARTVIGKPDRFVVVLQRKPAEASEAPGGVVPAAAGKPAPLHLSVPDGIPFENDETAIAHVLDRHLGVFFDSAEVEVEPPKGNFQVVNKCGITGELLGPPNYHRYAQIIQQHHAGKLPRMSFDSFRAKIETVRDPEVIKQWLDKMRKATRYTWKSGKPAAAPAENAAEPAGETPPPAPADGAAEAAPPVPAAEAPPTFDTLEEARTHLLAHAREKAVRPVNGARFHGKLIEFIPAGEIRRAIEGTLERQSRFPLDTANALRGRLRREGFTIFKKGSKGISYVCAVKRKFRIPGQVFSDSIGGLIAFIEEHPMIKAGDLPAQFLHLAPPEAAAAAPAETAAPKLELTPEQRVQLNRLQGDLAWLVHEGYVTEFIDGRLFAAPAVVEARKKEIEASEHDPENFPDSPPAAVKPATEEKTETPPAPSVPAEDAPVAEAPPAAEPAPAASGEGPATPAAAS